ncbi:MAG TPA: hypothetical protein VG270_01005 [Pseudolabrys sp.]|nr:hypothetical protein [Pseudolabrys sp.]
MDGELTDLRDHAPARRIDKVEVVAAFDVAILAHLRDLAVGPLVELSTSTDSGSISPTVTSVVVRGAAPVITVRRVVAWWRMISR